jgi:hypothetical protein
MIEFYHDSQEINFGAIRDKVTPGIPDYRLVQNQINTKYFKGLYSDGWVEQALSISLPADFAETSLAFTFEVMEPPADTAIIAGDLQCTLSTPFNKPLLYKLRRGSNLLRVALPRMVAAGTLQIHFEGGFKVRDNADQRTFYARLTSCVLEEKGFKNRIQRLLHSLSLSSGAISCEG